MKPEKMTPEDVETFNRVASGADESWDDRWRAWMEKGAAHLAALEAERDEAQAKIRSVVEVAERYGWNGVENSKILAVFVEHVFADRDALRERVKALEQEDSEKRQRWELARGEIRQQRERADRAEKRAMAAESTLAAFRQRAGDWRAMAETYEGPDTVSGGFQAVARYILGEDGAGHDALVLPGGTVLDVPPGFRAETAEPTATATLGPLWNAYQTAVATEPTTAEAFASIRREWGHGSPASERNLALLSLLERRMGAMGRAIRDFVHRDNEEPTAEQEGMLLAALTDAPPVFTLEEVERISEEVADEDNIGDETPDSAMAEAHSVGWTAGALAVKRRLAALRR